MMLQAIGNGNAAELNIRVIENNLTAQIEISGGTPTEAGAPEFRFGDVTTSGAQLSTMPLQIEIPPGETLSLRFDTPDALANSSFRLGELLRTGGTATRL